MSEPQGPGFDSPHLHPVDGGGVVVSPTTTTTSPPPTTTRPTPIDERYEYYDRGPHVGTLQEELGMNYIDGIYGPNTRRTHIKALVTWVTICSRSGL